MAAHAAKRLKCTAMETGNTALWIQAGVVVPRKSATAQSRAGWTTTPMYAPKDCTRRNHSRRTSQNQGGFGCVPVHGGLKAEHTQSGHARYLDKESTTPRLVTPAAHSHSHYV